MKVAIIIVNYNKKELLVNCLKSLSKLNYPDEIEMVVVDNGSNDGSEKHIIDNFKNVKLIQMGYNSGFCKANNVGIDFALKNGAQGIMMLNNDTEIDPNALTEIASKINIEKRIGMIATRILLYNNPGIIDASGFLITPDGLGKNLDAGQKAKCGSGEREVFCPTGAATFYVREVLEDVCLNGEYFDEDFNFYYEELDLGWRARLKGWRCLHCPDAIIYHHKSASAGTYSEFSAYHCNRNIFYNIVKNYPSWSYVFKALALSLARYVFLAGGLFVKKGVGSRISNKTGKLKLFMIFVRSMKDASLNMKSMLRKRKQVQGGKRVSDEEIRRWFRDLGLTFLESVYKL